ncbi:MAG: sensory rhodopsin transducer [Flavisolibacter sp.]
MEIGKKVWAIAEGYIPGWSTGEGREMMSHEAACILNTGGAEAHIELTIYFADKDPVGPYKIKVPPKRTLHLRFNDLKDPQPVPTGTDYSSVFISDVPVVIQHTRLDSRQSANALLSTMAFSQ